MYCQFLPLAHFLLDFNDCVWPKLSCCPSCTMLNVLCARWWKVNIIFYKMCSLLLINVWTHSSTQESHSSQSYLWKLLIDTVYLLFLWNVWSSSIQSCSEWMKKQWSRNCKLFHSASHLLLRSDSTNCIVWKNGQMVHWTYRWISRIVRSGDKFCN